MQSGRPLCRDTDSRRTIAHRTNPAALSGAVEVGKGLEAVPAAVRLVSARRRGSSLSTASPCPDKSHQTPCHGPCLRGDPSRRTRLPRRSFTTGPTCSWPATRTPALAVTADATVGMGMQATDLLGAHDRVGDVRSAGEWASRVTGAEPPCRRDQSGSTYADQRLCTPVRGLASGAARARVWA
jgi:hypothetical protein